MGRQSARIYFKSKDHKEIYFDGHYHDQAYIGNELVWEKLYGFGIESKFIEDIYNQYGTDGAPYPLADGAIAKSLGDGNGGHRMVIYKDGKRVSGTGHTVLYIKEYQVQDYGTYANDRGYSTYFSLCEYGENGLVSITKTGLNTICTKEYVNDNITSVHNLLNAETVNYDGATFWTSNEFSGPYTGGYLYLYNIGKELYGVPEIDGDVNSGYSLSYYKCMHVYNGEMYAVKWSNPDKETYLLKLTGDKSRFTETILTPLTGSDFKFVYNKVFYKYSASLDKYNWEFMDLETGETGVYKKEPAQNARDRSIECYYIPRRKLYVGWQHEWSAGSAQYSYDCKEWHDFNLRNYVGYTMRQYVYGIPADDGKSLYVFMRNRTNDEESGYKNLRVYLLTFK